eukprot:TRINITY_DN91229_c0_g1_i1.p1 TRINITY_DN91229_c0_g1~~TRINITY_DN91229_c0_g1_i1.p1  ORF type:complete len:383 (+),score=6.71 TRINITY_DN91229_c0_g1_i1:99-1247(+)
MPSTLISRHWDVLSFVVPVIVATLLLPLTRQLKQREVPLGWWVGLCLTVDVPHVYGTALRILLDSEALSKNRWLLLFAGPGLLCLLLLINLFIGTWCGWTLLAYFGMWHHIRFPFELVSLYRARKGDHIVGDYWWDYITCIAGGLIPVLLLHARAFPAHQSLTWFNVEERFITMFPAWTRIPLWLCYGIVPAAWMGRLVWQHVASGRQLNLGKFWIMFAQYYIWYMGISETQHVTSLAFINLFHGVASMALVRYVVQRRYAVWRRDEATTMKESDKLCEWLVASPFRYYGMMLFCALVEESLWEFLLLGDYLPRSLLYVRLPVIGSSNPLRPVVTSLLMWPQLVHYYLEGFVWHLSHTNPGLKEAVLNNMHLSDIDGASKET